MKNIAIKIKEVSKCFGNNCVLKNINLEVAEGESFTLIGRSGVGKSVLIKNIIGIIKPDSGSIVLNGVDTTKIPQNKLIKINSEIGIGMLFQGSALFDSLTIKENIIFFFRTHKKMHKDDLHEIALENVKRVGLSEKVLNMYPSELSGGMQRRVALARVIASKPRIIFFDEPTTGLDPIMSDVINNLIIEATQYLGATTFTITHDMKSAEKISNKIAMIENGEIIWTGISKDIYSSNNEIVDSFVRGISKKQ